MAFSASESAFEGFRIIRREPKTLLIWAVVLIAFDLIAVSVMLPWLRSAATGFGITPGAPANPAALGAMMGQVGLLYLIGIPLFLLITSVFGAGIYRAVLRPEEKGFGRLRLGADELRLAGVTVLVGLLFLGVSIAIGIVAAILGAGMVMATGRTGGAAGIGLLLVLVLYVAVLAGFAWVAVRLSFAAPMTFATRKIHVFSAWKLTKGRFWPLLGCYLLALVFVILVGLVDAAVSAVLAFGLSGGSLSRAATGVMRPDYASLVTLFTPLYIMRLIVGGAFGSVMWTVMGAAPASAYREIAGPKPEDQAAAFS